MSFDEPPETEEEEFRREWDKREKAHAAEISSLRGMIGERDARIMRQGAVLDDLWAKEIALRRQIERLTERVLTPLRGDVARLHSIIEGMRRAREDIEHRIGKAIALHEAGALPNTVVNMLRGTE